MTPEINLLDKNIPYFATNNITVIFVFSHTTHCLPQGNCIDCITNCLIYIPRKSSYFCNSILAWLSNFINPSPMYNKNQFQSSKLVLVSFTSLSTIYRKVNPDPIKQSNYFSSPSTIYQKVCPIPVKQFKCCLSSRPIISLD